MEHKIKYMNIAVTNRCNLRCVMCDIWKEKRKEDLATRHRAQGAGGRVSA